MWLIEYTDIAEAALMSLDKLVRERVLKYLRERVSTSDDPRMLAEPLKGELQGLWRFRVGDYRVISDVRTSIKVVEVLDLGHRSRVYKRIIR